ncbi:MAG: hypothetical protein QMC77_04790 [Methanocellales archaeon]|nr:hypothetical protein [Methanocellales archaeon]
MTYFCTKYQRKLAPKEIREHDCFNMKKGVNKDKMCSKLVIF